MQEAPRLPSSASSFALPSSQGKSPYLLHYIMLKLGGKDELKSLMNQIFQTTILCSNLSGEKLQNLRVKDLNLNSSPPIISFSLLHPQGTLPPSFPLFLLLKQ